MEFKRIPALIGTSALVAAMLLTGAGTASAAERSSATPRVGASVPLIPTNLTKPYQATGSEQQVTVPTGASQRSW